MPEHRGIFTSDAVNDFLTTEPVLTSEQLSGRLWTVSDGKYRTLFAEANESIVAFDTLGAPAKARAYRAEMQRRIPGKPISTIIYTHDHLDHTGYAADLAPDAQIVAHSMCDRVVRLRNADGQLPATAMIDQADTTVDYDGLRFRLLSPGPLHGTGHLSAYFTEERLFFSSDTILPNARYGLMPDIHLANFVKFMRGFLDLEFETFVPGRYEVTDRARFIEGCDYIDAMQTTCQQAFVELVPIWVYDAMAEYVKHALAKQFDHLDGFDEHVGSTAIRVVHHYLMGGWGLEDTPEPGLLLGDAG